MVFSESDVAVRKGAELFHGQRVALIFISADMESAAGKHRVFASNVFFKEGFKEFMSFRLVDIEMVTSVASGACNFGFQARKGE